MKLETKEKFGANSERRKHSHELKVDRAIKSHLPWPQRIKVKTSLSYEVCLNGKKLECGKNFSS